MVAQGEMAIGGTVPRVIVAFHEKTAELAKKREALLRDSDEAMDTRAKG
jgi:hypothetical protein